MASEEDEVAEDYRTALEELSFNNRNEISNLTAIARDYTAHSLKIAEVLQEHILKTAPSKKLPALYVLDSIVKNIGTPYTLYFGRNLFKTFMESYAVAQPDVRKRMEEMLKTWKQPVAGSLDTRPVFNPELVRPIENALMKFRQATMSQAPLPGRPRSAMPMPRDTPTPPGGRAYGVPPVGQPFGQANGHPGTPAYGQPIQQHGYPQQQPPYYNTTPQPQPGVQAPFQVPGSSGYPHHGAGVNREKLSSDIANLIMAMRAEQSQNPNDHSTHTRLKALGDLQVVMQSAVLPPDQLELIQNKVAELAAVTMRNLQSPGPATHNHNMTPQGYGLGQRPASQPPANVPVAHPPPPAHAAAPPGSVSLDSLLGPGALAALMGRRSATPQQQTTSTPTPQPAAAAVVRSPQPAAAQPAAGSSSNPLALLDQLRQRGLLPPTGTPTNTAPVAAPPPLPTGTAQLPPAIAQLLASRMANPQPPVPAPGTIDVAALKQQFRPQLIKQLYDELGPPCTQCGRRFPTDFEGKKKKTAHMDWHFKVHQRSTEAEKRGTHRSWFVDEKDWLKSREVVDTDQVAAAELATAEAAKLASASAEPTYIRVPEAGQGVNNVCPICQERFENKWLDTAQEWVWLDATLVGGRAFHASCRAEAAGDRKREGSVGGLDSGGGAMGSVLGKRKAEKGLESPKVRSLKTFG